MEKQTAHYHLFQIQTIVQEHGLGAFTRTAVDNAMLMGLTEMQIIETVLGMNKTMFYKSMTTHADHTVWQDVYHVPCQNGLMAYVKLTLQNNFVVIQFKEK